MKRRGIIEYVVTAERDDDGWAKTGDIGYVNLPENLTDADMPDSIFIDGYEYKLES